MFDYEEMVQDGLRGVVREALAYAAENGLPGAHHFYISFRTDYPGVEIPDFLRERHPEEVTIVIQHQFWDLEVDERGFSILLSFSEAHEKVYVPFYALLSFMDPSAKFGLQFNPPPYDEVFLEIDESIVEPTSEDAGPKDNVVTLDTFRKKK
ncbi:Stringent starvation protein B [Candidatus Bealeia paramacronuclearis]|uniref:Stringent starvation protein B n=1 Tax=Candidatus Bealeia paramacronuclearis TaxID=1921001 RepID=A0ABZ2C2K1_9PROT|nr:Stringent starvation protein B [Candidatus Bealeia paramacronuclearis]